jgi:hypothetical protein
MVIAILGIIVSVAIMIYCYVCSEDELIVTFAIFGALGLFLFLTALHIQDMPSAMDVYRGKTTLKITYVDSVAVDSVVVFKE